MEDKNNQSERDELDLDQDAFDLAGGAEKNVADDDLKTEEDGGVSNDVIEISKAKIVLAKKLILNIKENNEKLLKILGVLVSDEDDAKISISQIGEEKSNFEDNKIDEEGQIIEGVFDGENMIGPDGKEYSVPANYASKSKLVEGDILKLIITVKGTFVYKQIGPIDRIRQVGVLDKDSDGNFIVNAEGKFWRVLNASVTFFKGQAGDEAVVLIPKTGQSKWGALENVIRNNEI